MFGPRSTHTQLSSDALYENNILLYYTIALKPRAKSSRQQGFDCSVAHETTTFQWILQHNHEQWTINNFIAMNLFG